MKQRNANTDGCKQPTAHDELKMLQALLREMRALWATCDLIERRWQIAGLEVAEPTSHADAFESCGRLKTAIETVLPAAENHYIEHLEVVAACSKSGLAADKITSAGQKAYVAWLKSVVKLQFTTRSWRERLWLEIDGLPWTDAERSTIVWQLLWESTPPKWLSLACHHHRLPLVSEPPALGGFIEALDRPDQRPKILTTSQLADWAEGRINKPSRPMLGKVGLATE